MVRAGQDGSVTCYSLPHALLASNVETSWYDAFRTSMEALLADVGAGPTFATNLTLPTCQAGRLFGRHGAKQIFTWCFELEAQGVVFVVDQQG